MPTTLKCEVCGADNPADHYYCGYCGNGLRALGSIPDDGLINTTIEGERRQVTIVFADISGFTALNDAAQTPAEVEQVVRLINLCLQELSEAIYEYEGYIDKYIGDAIMAVFGAPKAHEDDPERALRAALAMQERLEKFNQNPPMPLPEPLGIHIGINTGTVIAGMVGTDRKRSYTVMGDAVNVASRLEDVSERGEILLSEATYTLTSRLFIFKKRPPVKVKGKRDPIKIYELKGARDVDQTQRGLVGMEAPLIGREYESKVLLDRYEKLKQGQGGIIVVTGEAGLGKSRLVSDFRRQVNRDGTNGNKPLWLFGRGLSYRQSFTNRLIVDILHRYLELPENPDPALVRMRLEAMGDDLFGPRAPEVVPFLATLLGLKLDEQVAASLPLDDPQALQQRVFVAVGEWLEILAQKQPVILVFEDLHWADPNSVKVIEYLFSLTLKHPILIICVTRPERESTFWNVKIRGAKDYPDRFVELTLWPLTDEESRQLIKHLLNLDDMPAATEQLLLKRAEGNPLFLEEVLRSLIESGIIRRSRGRWEITRTITEIDIPNTLQGVLTARIDRLEEPVKRVMQIAAVIGRVFPRFILEPIVNDPEILDKALEELELADLIKVRTPEPEPEYMFKHYLTYETAYSSLLHHQRTALHRQIADYMSRLYWQLGEEYAAIVAEHYCKSETWPRALRYLHRAGDAAVQSFANREAIDFYTRALQVAEKLGSEADPATVLAVYEGRAKILARMGDPQQAIDDFQQMLTIAREINNHSAQLRALNGIAALHASYYNFTQASDYFREALEVARHIGDERGIADTLNRLGDFYYNLGELELASACFHEAQELSLTLKDEPLRLEAADGLAKIMLQQGEIAAAIERYKEITQAHRRLGYRNRLMDALSVMLVAYTFSASYHQAEETAAEILELNKKSGDLNRIPFVKYYLAFGQLYQGELGKAGQNLQEGLEVAAAQEHKAWLSLGTAWLAYYYLTIGMDHEGLQQARQSVELAEQLQSPLYVMRSKTMLGTAYRHLKRLDEALHVLQDVHEVAHSMGYAIDEVMVLYQLIRACIDAQAWDKAHAHIKRLLDLAVASDMKEFLIRGWWLKSLIAIHHQQYEAALEYLLEAANLAEETDSRLSNFIIQIQKAYVYHVSGNAPASRDAVVYAQKIQKRLLDSLPDDQSRLAFLNSKHAGHLREMVEVHFQSRPPVDVLAGEAAE